MRGRDFERELDAAVRAVREAALFCRAAQARLPPAVQKEDRSPVTLADWGSQALVARALERSLPEDPLLAEEDSTALRAAENGPLAASLRELLRASGADADLATICRWIDRGAQRRSRERFWTLDPIDGTKGFLRREQYAIALGLVVDGRVVVAALACPQLRFPSSLRPGALFSAVAGGGAFSAPLDDERAAFARIQVSGVEDIRRARICESAEAAHSSHAASSELASLLGTAAPSLRMDSQAKYAAVARGDAEVYLRLPTKRDYREKIWDHAAGSLIVAEAGGCVTDVAGRALDFSRGAELAENRGIVATSSKAIHERVLAALPAAGVEP